MKKLIPLVALAAVVAAAPAFAATTVTQNVSFNNQTTDFSLNGTFSLFDSSLGQLTAVNIEDTYGFTTTITITNTGSSSVSGRANTFSDLAITAANSAQNQAIQNLLYEGSDGYTDSSGHSQQFAYDNTTSSGQQSFTVAGNSSKTLAQATAATADSGVVSTSLAADLAAFTASQSNGTTGSINLKTLTGTTLSNTGGNFSASQATNANGGFSIFYTYTAAAVPEPATWAMMIAGFGLVGFGLRRKGAAVLFN